MLHSQFGRWEKVDSRLLVVGSQTTSLTLGPSFAHNLGCRCPNGQCEAIFDIYVSRTFPTIPKTLQCKVFWALLSSSKHSGVPADSKPLTFPSVGLHPHTWPKWGCDTTSFSSQIMVKSKFLKHPRQRGGGRGPFLNCKTPLFQGIAHYALFIAQ